MRTLVLLPICAAAYLAWPCVALYQMNTALQGGDVATLAAAADWDKLREGLKEDVADGIIGTDSTTASVDVSANALPPFGASFVKGMAGNAVDRMVTPERLAAAFAPSSGVSALMPRRSSIKVWFDSVTRFEASVRLAGDTKSALPLRLQLELMRTGWDFQWRVTRAFVPADLFAVLGETRTALVPSHKVFAGQ